MIVAKWGNSLAVRLPADVARDLGLKEGDDIHLRAAKQEEVATFLDADLRRARGKRLDKLAIPAPDDFRFDREEANAR